MKQQQYLVGIAHWGPSAWRFLHAVSFTVDSKKQLEYQAFFENLPMVLPCKSVCQPHLIEVYKRLPINVSSPRACSEWLVNVHNEVNKSNGKPEFKYLDVVLAYVPSSMFATLDLSPEELSYIEQKQKEELDVVIWPWILVAIAVIILCALITHWINRS